jgi:hypothetical protein
MPLTRLVFRKDPLQEWIPVQPPHHFVFRILILETKNHKLPGFDLCHGVRKVCPYEPFRKAPADAKRETPADAASP